ncbi:MAG TPA: cellulase N-terminal Ig-like domain-containing protein, partial [Anditalea sp.]|nr:cellulase N-terminal Ig-like domain-containing protein [Anditalea sp.]
KHEPVIQVSQVGYHPSQQKVAVIETDVNDTDRNPVQLIKIGTDGNDKVSLKSDPKEWGEFLRYNYLQFDFSEVTDPGLYMIQYGDHKTHAFQINPDVYKRDVWQPTLEYFLPVQMCHVRVNDRYKVWHGLCHMDDAHMAPVDINHFDGYVQGPLPLLTSIPVTMFPN